ncbi:AAA family ATPase [Tuwongella immobilis]|uniref:AAA+ ATPase domain-containing protein n=1 Tax=Tuwongella immobilis TaxID=692036 RepID=A0A6C2YGW9_9BACT
MNLLLPIYISSHRDGTQKRYRVRPVFQSDPEAWHERMDQAVLHFQKRVETVLRYEAENDRNDPLAAWSFRPELVWTRANVELDLRSQIHRFRLPFVRFTHWGKAIAVCPEFPDVWFDCPSDDQLVPRANRVLTQWLRRQQQEAREADARQQTFHGLRIESYQPPASFQGNELLVEVRLPNPKRNAKSLGMLLGGGESMSGREELARVGESLDRLDPERRMRAYEREAEVEQLLAWMNQPKPMPLMLVGPRLVGKTALIHELIARRNAGQDSLRSRGQQFWHVSPGRLISGMSFVGQWEQRLLVILKHMRRSGHVLVLDDLVGLFRAGQSASSILHVAQVLKPFLERREIRLLAEITPEALRVLQELDRGFADLFDRLPVHEPNQATARRMVYAAMSALEGQFQCRFPWQAMPTAFSMHQFLDRSSALPGGVVRILERAAIQFRGMQQRMLGQSTQSRIPIEQPSFPSRMIVSGIRRLCFQQYQISNVYDDRTTIRKDDLRERMVQSVIGQPEAVDALMDLLWLIRARLNDPKRPAASVLMMGPTGVGKTECARALATLLFGDPRRMIRFDLNEFGEPGSAARLIGTFHHPEGLLTAAVRSQPFSIILFDEIEKADQEVVDLLLQVLGEGRLTDALGRTADFTNTLILMTSNLGVTEAESSFGFGTSGNADRRAVYLRAAQRAFRPEFFNRIDRIVPFNRLTREHIRLIADRQVKQLLEREGLRQRRVVLQILPAAIERIVEIGFEPTLGARALKRSLEQNLVTPLAIQMAEVTLDAIWQIDVLPNRPTTSGHTPDPRPGIRLGIPPGIRVVGRILPTVPTVPTVPAVSSVPPGETESESDPAIVALPQLRQRIQAMQKQIDHWQRQHGIEVGRVENLRSLSPHQEHTLQLKERLLLIRDAMRELEPRSSFDSEDGASISISPSAVTRSFRRGHPRENRFGNMTPPMRELLSREDLTLLFRELAVDVPPTAQLPILALDRQLRVLEIMADLPIDDSQLASEVVLLVRISSIIPEQLLNGISFFDVLTQIFHAFSLGVQIEHAAETDSLNRLTAIRLLGLHAQRIADLLEGTLLMAPEGNSFLPISFVRPPESVVAPNQSLAEIIVAAQRADSEWVTNLESGRASDSVEVFPLGPVWGILLSNRSWFDFSSGGSHRGFSLESLTLSWLNRLDARRRDAQSAPESGE